MKNKWNNYKWFIKESQSFMEGHNKVIVFVKSIFKGFGFVKYMGESSC